VLYVGKLESNGVEFDSSQDPSKPFSFTLGNKSVITGWDDGVATMRKGEIATLTCRQDYAYGENGSPPTIPPNATLIFEVELLSWDDPEPDTPEEKIKAATKRKEEGNSHFKQGNYSKAAEQYTAAIDYFKQSWGMNETQQKETNDINLLCLLNLAACQLKTKDYSEAVLSCSKALDIDTNNVKALFRRGQAYSQKGDYSLAKADLQEALHHSPNSKEIRQEMDNLKKNIANYKDKQKQMYSGLFDKMSKSSGESSPKKEVVEEK